MQIFDDVSVWTSKLCMSEVWRHVVELELQFSSNSELTTNVNFERIQFKGILTHLFCSCNQAALWTPCPSVRPSLSYLSHRIITKFSGAIAIDKNRYVVITQCCVWGKYTYALSCVNISCGESFARQHMYTHQGYLYKFLCLLNRLHWV